LIADQSAFAEQWDREVVCSRGLGPFDDLFTGEDADEVIDRGLRQRFVRLLQDGKALDPARFTRPVFRGRTDDAVIQADAVRRHVTDGMTLSIVSVDQCWPPLASYCRELAEEIGTEMFAGVYLTPPRSRGAGPHYDVMNVFIRQVEGQKRWEVREPATWWPTKTWEKGMQADTAVIMETTLKAGDCLYVPRGFIHDGWTEDAGSLHVTFSGDRPVTWVDVLRRVVIKLGDKDMKFRGALPVSPQRRPEVLRDSVSAVLTDLQQVLSDLDAGAIARELAGRLKLPSDEPSHAQPLIKSLRGGEDAS
jgi:bifunctional lysine-specific demethylase and histidyl-hydroxylase NO66